jgi:hexosaminidase
MGNASYFHIGGDEAVFDGRVTSAEVTAYQRSLGLDVPSTGRR